MKPKVSVTRKCGSPVQI